MAPALTAEEIRHLNTRYHDAAAERYDSKWGIDFGKIGREQVVVKVRKALGRAPGRYARPAGSMPPSSPAATGRL